MQPKKQSPSPPERKSTGRSDGVAPRVDPAEVDPQGRANEHDPVSPPKPGNPSVQIAHPGEKKKPDGTY